MRLGNDQARLKAMLALTVLFFFVEIIVGYITNSMALIADSFHMFSDAIALIIAFISVRMSPKKWSKNTFGWARAEILGALVNAVFLCALCFSILIESVKRFVNKDEIHKPELIIYVGGLGLFINLIGLVMFKDSGHLHHHHHHHHHHNHNHKNKSHNHLNHANHSDLETHVHGDTNTHHNSQEINEDEQLPIKTHGHGSQMNMRGVFLHIMADALSSVIVMISAIIFIIFTEWEYRYYIDPILSVLMVCLILRSTWPLFTDSAMILLQTVPTNIEIDSLRRRLTEEIPGVLAVHEFHVWQLAGDRIIASAHIRCHNLDDYMRIAGKVKEFFHNEGIHSTTIQPEFTDLNIEVGGDGDENCALDCPSTQRTQCAPQTCCGGNKASISSANKYEEIGNTGGDEQSHALLTRRNTEAAKKESTDAGDNSEKSDVGGQTSNGDTSHKDNDNYEVILSMP